MTAYLQRILPFNPRRDWSYTITLLPNHKTINFFVYHQSMNIINTFHFSVILRRFISILSVLSYSLLNCGWNFIPGNILKWDITNHV